MLKTHSPDIYRLIAGLETIRLKLGERLVAAQVEGHAECNYCYEDGSRCPVGWFFTEEKAKRLSGGMVDTVAMLRLKADPDVPNEIAPYMALLQWVHDSWLNNYELTGFNPGEIETSTLWLLGQNDWCREWYTARIGQIPDEAMFRELLADMTKHLT